MSIRYKIFGAFSVVILLACGLAFYGIRGISTSGDLVVRLYDGPLMGINHARSAHAGLNEARLIMQRSLIGGTTSEAVARFEKLIRNIGEDLSVVRERVQSANVKIAREKAESGLRDWSAAGLKILKPTPGGLTAIPTSYSLMQQGDDAVAALDDLVELEIGLLSETDASAEAGTRWKMRALPRYHFASERAHDEKDRARDRHRTLLRRLRRLAGSDAGIGQELHRSSNRTASCAGF
jgi:methyl-accepting chemotaxis protein